MTIDFGFVRCPACGANLRIEGRLSGAATANVDGAKAIAYIDLEVTKVSGCPHVDRPPDGPDGELLPATMSVLIPFDAEAA